MTYLVAISTAAAALGGFALAGSAIGSEWKTYDGRVSAGQAYLIDVPEGADGLQLEFAPGLLSLGGGSAHATLFSPDDERVGHYMLSDEENLVAIDAPESGGYVLYVFEVQGGVLTVALKAEDAEDLELVPLLTETTNHEIAGQSIVGSFRAVDTLTLDREPVYESLLYQGSANNLSGTVTSPLGETSVVDMETGTAHGPGLFTSQSGERASFPENFAAGIHAIDVTADEFEGTLFLTTVDYVRPEISDVLHPVHPVEVPANVIMLHDSWEATAVMVPEGVSSLDFGLIAAPAEEDEDEDEHDHYYDYAEHALLAVFTPDDRLLGFVELDEEEAATASLPLEGPGEYVVFVYSGVSEDAMLFAALDGGLGIFGGERHLKVSETATPLAEVSSPLAYSESFTVDMVKAPLAAGVGIDGQPGWAMDLRSVIHTEMGEAETYEWNFRAFDEATPWGGHMMHATYIGPELVTGAWEIDVEALSAMGTVTLYTLDYDRLLGDDEVEEEDEEEEPEEDEGVLPLPRL